jgi:hypothetical protein
MSALPNIDRGYVAASVFASMSPGSNAGTGCRSSGKGNPRSCATVAVPLWQTTTAHAFASLMGRATIRLPAVRRRPTANESSTNLKPEVNRFIIISLSFLDVLSGTYILDMTT